MRATSRIRGARSPQRGMTLWTVTAGLFILLGISALAIDLAALYVARNEAQRAADAAALAGAKKLVESGYLSNASVQAAAETAAREEAKSIGAQNGVGGVAASIADADVTFDFTRPNNPLVTVAVQRSVARGNPMPTFFSKVLGFLNADVSATATAEAYNSSGGGGPPVGTGCLKPWILPNCDPTHSIPENPNCPGNAYFVDPSTGQITYPGQAPTGVIGAQLLLKPGLPGDAPTPSQFYPIQIPPGTEPSICPSCAQNTVSTSGTGAAIYEKNTSCCNTNQLYCGQQLVLNRQTGNMVGPTNQGVSCLIHQDGNVCAGSASGCGQDYLLNPPSNMSIVGGYNNPNPALRGQTVSSSDSIVTVPLYAGENPCPGGSATCATVTIVGFLQVFVEKSGPPQSTVTGYVLNIAGCGGGGSGGGTGGGSGGSGSGTGGTGTGNSSTITGAGGSPYPVRLVRRTN